ncbi:DUF4232 domain-containing protein [Streptomyces sp. NPDC088354]|uniref:DUF4232 domain-containing protein n=1 Tax=unclassified Streptomyces TaxID=2593676 RepID=UPI0029AA6BFC|nr:DUF4232 domain-containing protein [Streptomyces sp. MI02-7b]MDX3073443.1 DUF4232 domain-containing protein [Streptomyces sp. MI02-7b]
MRTLPLTVSAVLAGVLVLTACGTRSAGIPGGGVPRAAGPSCRPAPATAGATGATGEDGTEGVGIVGSDVASPSCGPALQVTNHGSEPFTYTVTLSFSTASGAAMDSTEQTVAAVAPGRTVRRPVDLAAGGVRSADLPLYVKVLQVRSVPTDEAPAPAGSCPSSGVRVTADRGDAAMGLRVVGLHLENCSQAPHRVEGYPRLQLLDAAHRPVTGIRILHGSETRSVTTGFDDPPRPVTLQPGETASAGLIWRNTVTFGDPVNAPYVRVFAEPGASPVMVTPELDLGTTGKLGVSAWQKSAIDAWR